MKRLLLISSSTVHGSGYLDHCSQEVRDFLGAASRALFVPYALHDLDAYAEKVEERFARLEIRIDSIHRAADPRRAVRDAKAIFVGGGNTFRLLDRLYRLDLIEAIRSRVQAGMPYMGSSAGTNIAGLTIKTTNDMPIVYPPSFEALGLVPFQINPHYLDPDPNSKHMGETRETRIREFHEMNEAPVLGIREGAWLRIEGKEAMLKGSVGARLFRRSREPEEFAPNSRLDFLLG